MLIVVPAFEVRTYKFWNCALKIGESHKKMSAIVRIKRRCDEEPLDALLLNCKRRKVDEFEAETEESLSAVLKFAGTVENQDEDVLKHIKQSTKADIEDNYKKHFADVKEKIREQIQEASKNNRYRVVNLFRSNVTSEPDMENTKENDPGITIVDVEEVVKKDNEETSKYVYDVYYTSSDDLGEFYEHDLIGIYPVNEQLVFDNDPPNSEPEDSDDSNDENNWRNDYPEEEDGGSVTEEDMLAAMNKMQLGEDLSSDDGEEGFIYSIDSEAAGFEEDIDDSDVNRYGEQYARFKARCKQENSDDSYDYAEYD